MKIKTNLGFDNRIFLTEEEWKTYNRRKPVRYIKKKKTNFCEICNKPAEEGNPFENSHLIGFGLGVTYLGLTPEYVDGDNNIVCAHRKICNSKAELDLHASCKELKSRGVKSLPKYLPEFVLEVWELS